uniref:Uncharacterized protein n=1 Tax=Tanacetum cinerariifolium TaxID=118510 RepID=A0A6L2MI12_TANCI|nr:hypothetical protein [Tanacetum cinerariifolium]
MVYAQREPSRVGEKEFSCCWHIQTKEITIDDGKERVIKAQMILSEVQVLVTSWPSVMCQLRPRSAKSVKPQGYHDARVLDNQRFCILNANNYCSRGNYIETRGLHTPQNLSTTDAYKGSGMSILTSQIGFSDHYIETRGLHTPQNLRTTKAYKGSGMPILSRRHGKKANLQSSRISWRIHSFNSIRNSPKLLNNATVHEEFTMARFAQEPTNHPDKEGVIHKFEP